MKELIKGILIKILSVFPTLKIIFFESVPDLSDNTKAVFDEMVKRGLNEKYKMVWLVSKKAENLPKIKNVYYLETDSRFFRFKKLYYHYFSKALICCNGFWETLRKGQVSFYLTHGTALKHSRSYYRLNEKIDYMIVDGRGTLKMMAYELNYAEEKTVALGFPRNDVLTGSPKNIHYLFPENKGEKIAVWYPTFRQHKTASLNATENALPIIYDEAQAKKLNEIAKRNKVLIVLKPHFAQDVSKIKACNLSNIKFIDDNFFAENQISSYQFLAACDALITDYSSVYYDYLLCDKPIALVWEDYEEYRQTTDFAVDMDYYMQAGEKIYNLNDFEIFLKNLALGKDNLKEERLEISKWANYSNDGKSAERVTDFIIEKASL